MAISLPSDIVLDVARAVEPAGVEAARAELARRSGGASAGDAPGVFSLTEATADRTSAAAGAEPATPESFKRFEAMVLQTFIQNMLPKGAGEVYGKGVAGDMWKSLMAEQLAGVMAKRGGIGISERVLRDHYVEGEKTLPVGAVSGGPDQAEADREAMLSAALVEQMQLRIARTLAEDRDQSSTVDETMYGG